MIRALIVDRGLVFFEIYGIVLRTVKPQKSAVSIR